jgi:lipopolysaccharide export system ATP-binding protein
MNDVAPLGLLSGTAADPAVSTDGLNVVSIAKSYDKKVVLSDVSLQVAKLLFDHGAGEAQFGAHHA